MHGTSSTEEDFMCFMELGLDSDIQASVGRREGSVLITSPESAEIRGNVALHTSTEKHSASVSDGTLSMIDNYSGLRLNHNVITKLLQGFRECFADSVIQVIRIEEGVISRKFIAGVAEGVNDRMEGPEDPPRKGTKIIVTWSHIKVW